MTTTMEKKIANPLNFYNQPLEVEQDQELMVEQKITLLKNWLDDIKLRQIAEAENMLPTKDIRYHAADVEHLIAYYETELSKRTSNHH